MLVKKSLIRDHEEKTVRVIVDYENKDHCLYFGHLPNEPMFELKKVLSSDNLKVGTL